MIRILCIDDHTIFRSGLRQLLLDEPDLRITGEASNGAEAIDLIRARPFEVALLDINMEGRNGFEILNSIRHLAPRLPVLMLSMYPEQQYALVALRQGARGYVAKDAEPSELVSAIRRVAAGEHYLSARAAPLVSDQIRGDDPRHPHERLSVREHQIMMMMIKGMSLTDIGTEMMISVKTVSSHRTHILEKIGVGSTAELVLYAVRQGLVH